jgi:hypothetical protein
MNILPLRNTCVHLLFLLVIEVSVLLWLSFLCSDL